MAEIIWTEPALNDLDSIANYIAKQNPEAAIHLVRKVFRRGATSGPSSKRLKNKRA